MTTQQSWRRNIFVFFLSFINKNEKKFFQFFFSIFFFVFYLFLFFRFLEKELLKIIIFHKNDFYFFVCVNFIKNKVFWIDVAFPFYFSRVLKKKNPCYISSKKNQKEENNTLSPKQKKISKKQKQQNKTKNKYSFSFLYIFLQFPQKYFFFSFFSFFYNFPCNTC